MTFPHCSFTVSNISPNYNFFFVCAPKPSFRDSAHRYNTDSYLLSPWPMWSCFAQLEETILFQFLEALSQIAHNSPSSLPSQSTFNDTQGCGVPKLIQVRRIFFIIMLLFNLSTEKMREKREDFFFSGSFRSLKKNIHLKDKEFKRFYTESTRKQSEMKNSSEGEETCARRRAWQSLPLKPTLPQLFLWEDRLHLYGSKNIRGLQTGIMVFCLQRSLK